MDPWHESHEEMNILVCMSNDVSLTRVSLPSQNLLTLPAPLLVEFILDSDSTDAGGLC